MKKITIITFIVVISLITFYCSRHSTPQELGKAFRLAAKAADSVSHKADTYQVEIYYNGRSIMLWQHDPIWDDYVMSFSINEDSSKIILDYGRFANRSSHGWSTFGFGHEDFRIFTNAEDFHEKFNKILTDRNKDITMSDYYPRLSWSNIKLSWRDGDWEYKYPAK